MTFSFGQRVRTCQNQTTHTYYFSKYMYVPLKALLSLPYIHATPPAFNAFFYSPFFLSCTTSIYLLNAWEIIPFDINRTRWTICIWIRLTAYVLKPYNAIKYNITWRSVYGTCFSNIHCYYKGNKVTAIAVKVCNHTIVAQK